MLKGISIQCHYTKIDDVEIFDFVNKHGTNIVALPDETGIYSAKGKWSVAGDKSAFLFTKEHKIELKHGSKLSF